MEGRKEWRAECTQGEERGTRRLKVEEETGEVRKGGLEERMRRLGCKVH